MNDLCALDIDGKQIAIDALLGGLQQACVEVASGNSLVTVEKAGGTEIAPPASDDVLDSVFELPDDVLDITKEEVNGTGKLTGSINGLTDAEKKVVNDLIDEGYDVEIIPTDPESKKKTPDFNINGVKTELKSLQNPNTNTAMKRIQEGFKQGAETVIIDAREASMTANQAQEVLDRAIGKYPNKQFPGNVEIWINGEIITFP